MSVKEIVSSDVGKLTSLFLSPDIGELTSKYEEFKHLVNLYLVDGDIVGEYCKKYLVGKVEAKTIKEFLGRRWGREEGKRKS